MSDSSNHVRIARQSDCSGMRHMRRRSTMADASEPKLESILTADNLIQTFWRLAQSKGQAPGADGVRYSDLGSRETALVMRWLPRFIRYGGVYLPQRARVVEKPKSSGGVRQLHIQSILDRVVASALTDAMTPFWEARFAPGSFGFRRDRSAWEMLAHHECLVTDENLPVLVVEDIKTAFDAVRQDHLMRDHEQHLRSTDLLWLIDVILHGWSAHGRRTVGIYQGNPYSPTALNVRLHHAHDLPMIASQIVFLRYADNHLYPCADHRQAERVREQAAACLSETDLQFKPGGRCCVDLREQQSSPVLGFRLMLCDRGLRYRIDDTATGVYADLRRMLHKAHLFENPPQRACEVLTGWIDAYGPAWCDDDVCANAAGQMLRMVEQLGFRGTATEAELAAWMQTAQNRWNRLRARVRGRWTELRVQHGLSDCPVLVG